MPSDIRTVKCFAKFLLPRRIDQRHFGAFDDGDIGTPSLLHTPQRENGRRLHPLIAAYGGNAEQINLRCAEKHQQGEKIRSLWAGAVLVGNDFDLLLLSLGETCEQQAND